MAETSPSKLSAMPKHGDFCWTEIASTDLGKCQTFYSNVFGWKFEKSHNAGNEFVYLECSSGGGEQMDAALYEMNPAMFGGKAPPAHIALYVSVDNVDESAAKAVELGGSIVFGPYDIPKVGRIAVINDPTGSAISLITFAAGEIS